MLHLKVSDTPGKAQPRSWTQQLLQFSLGLILPKANPDFEAKIDKVWVWLLEFEDEQAVPEREIGLDADSVVILQMPYGDNYGYWTDNQLTFRDFQSTFKTDLITREYFEEKWNSFL
jgi:hypothetical protein